MNHLALARTAVALAPFVAAAITAALTISTRYDRDADVLTITVRKLRPATTALATLRVAAR